MEVQGLSPEASEKRITLSEVWAVPKMNISVPRISERHRQTWRHLENLDVQDCSKGEVQLLLGANVLEAVIQHEFPRERSGMWGGAVRQVVAARGVPSRPCVRMCVFVAVLVTLCVGVSHAQTSVPPPGVGEVVYSKPQLNTSYRASTEFDPQGMEHLYYVTNMFLDVIQKDDVAALGAHRAARDGTGWMVLRDRH
ncbi:hypothetical protein FJT64_025408 [Amphibalanus amphitrite]|uniref:Uncharacterized protein n=1 Tax=Amphibalanus amphitrite TaxID=1232801 RepID=A0A6A4WKW0_AMPAM|nr:hypothetical protein FJT64_025408 [Amphibalanus amphitrite]